VLSLCELRRAASVLEAQLVGHHIDRVVEPARDRIALAFYGRDAATNDGSKRFLLLCCRPGSARVSELDALPRASDRPPAFVSYLRKHLSRARLVSVKLLGGDRQLALGFEGREGRFDVVLSMLGKRSNLYVVDVDEPEPLVRIAQRAPADTRPEMVAGAVFTTPSGAPPPEGDDRFNEVGDAEYLHRIEAHYAEREAGDAQHALARDLRQVLKRESKNAERRLQRIEEELAEADRATELQRHGELLKGVLGQIKAGANEVKVEDYESGDEVTIPLDPTKSPRANLEATFKKYQKMLRRLSKAGGQVDDAGARCESLAALKQRLDRAVEDDDTAALEALAGEPEIARLLGKRRTAQAPPMPGADEKSKLPARFRDLPRKLHPRRYLADGGMEIWVGRSDEGNDYLTTRLARGKDLFFHLDGAPGSHVILRTEGRSDPPSEAVLDACELAVHYSKQKSATRADVHVVPIKQVKKPKGAKRGLVWVTGGKSIHLRRDEKRLARVLKAKIEG
jgi:predicted ribosome quality control (RQC) complex YloA/Tae2 family protein